MAINGTLFATSKTKNEIDSVEIFKSMMLEVNASGAVVMDGRNIAAGSIYANQLSADSITANKIKAGEITTDHITTSGISADKIKAGTLTATNGASWINMNDGKFSFGGGKITYNGSVLAVNVDSLQITNKSVATETYVTSSVAPAISAASAAQTTANTATTNAATAQTAANAAQTSANTATTNAATAKSAADAAQTTANTANSTANTAKTNAATAQTAANTASGSASTANSLLADLASDSKLTASEKKASKKEWDIIVSEKTKIETEASDYGITAELSTFTTQYNALSSYITSLLADLSATSTIVGTTFRTNFKNYYDAKQDLLNAITTKAKSLADTAAVNASTAQTAANTANTAAGAAQSTANTANGTANTAKTNAATAQTAANTANTAAGAAQTTANTANTAAGAAQGTANTANSTANTANSTANTAKTNAGTAQTAANTAQATADVVKGVVTNFDSVIINANPIFLDWTSTYPTGYTSSAGGVFAKVTSGNGMGNALRYTATAGSNAYLNPVSITTSPFFSYVSIEVTFKLDSGTIDGSGILFRYTATSNVDYYIKLKELMPSPVLGKWYTVNKIIKQASAPSGFTGYQIYVMGAWTSFETVTAKVIQFDSVKTRPANEQEINAYENNIKIEDWTYTGTTEISGGKIRADSVTATQIAASTITATQIAANTITAAKIAASTITATQIATNAITADKILADSITTVKIAAGAITATEIAAATITGAKIVTDTITATQIAASTITATQIATNAITADKILADSVTTAKIAAGAITATEIATATITAAKIVTDTITATQIAASTITATQIAANTITAAKIAAGTITATQIAANSLTIGNINPQVFSQGYITTNPVFSNWTSTYPSGYTAWSGSAGFSKETVLSKNGGNGVQFEVAAAATQTGLQLLSTGTIDNQILPQYLMVEVDFMLVSGTIAGAGLLIDWNGVTGGNRVDFSLVKEVPSPVLNKWYTVRRVIKAPSTAGSFSSIAGFLMGNYSPLGGAIKNIVFDRVALREPSLEEVNSFGWTVAGTTEINGAKIKTGTLTADDIKTGKMTNSKGNVVLDLDAGNLVMKNTTTKNTSTLTDGELNFLYTGEAFPIRSNLGNGSLSLTREADVHPYTTEYGLNITFGQGEGYQVSSHVDVGRGAGFGINVNNSIRNVLDVGELDSRWVGFPSGTGDAYFDTDYSSFQFLKPTGFPNGILANRIPANSNLNNFITAGHYYSPTDADTATIANTPTNNAFSLDIVKHAGVRQVFKVYLKDTPLTYERNYYSGSWGRWVLTAGNTGGALSMRNSWGFYGGTTYLTPQYWLTGDDMVHIGGLIDYGTKTGSVIVAVIPVGFRPANREMFSVYGYNKAGLRVDVTAAGEVICVDAPAGFVSLSGISFRRDWYQ